MAVWIPDLALEQEQISIMHVEEWSINHCVRLTVVCVLFYTAILTWSCSLNGKFCCLVVCVVVVYINTSEVTTAFFSETCFLCREPRNVSVSPAAF